MIPLVTFSLVGGAVADASHLDDAREDELHGTIMQLDRALEAVQRDIDELDAWVSDRDIVIFEDAGQLLPFDLDGVDELLPLARQAVIGQPELQRLMAHRIPQLAQVIFFLEATASLDADDIGPTVREMLRQNPLDKLVTAATHRAGLVDQSKQIDSLIDEIQTELDAHAGGFPPAWVVEGGPGAIDDRFGVVQPDLVPDFSIMFENGHSELCWTLEGLHWCRGSDGWSAVYVDAEEGFRGFILASQTSCDLTVPMDEPSPRGQMRCETTDSTPAGAFEIIRLR